MSATIQDGEIHELATGLSYQWLEGGRIIKYIITSHHTDTVNAFAENVLMTMKNWSPDKPYCAIYEVTHPKVIFTPYVRKTITMLDDSYPQLKGRSAGVITNEAVNQALRLFTFLRAKKGGRQKRLFATQAEAVQWLLDV